MKGQHAKSKARPLPRRFSTIAGRPVSNRAVAIARRGSAEVAFEVVVRFGSDVRKRLILSLWNLEGGNRSFIKFDNGESFPLPVENFPLVKL